VDNEERKLARMSSLTKYCSAYLVSRFRAFPGWPKPEQNTQKERSAKGELGPPRTLRDEDHLFIHQSYVVTDGIYENEHVIYKDLTPEWLAFVRNELHFKIPDDIKPTDGPDAVPPAEKPQA
jgi:hypothetical protein